MKYSITLNLRNDLLHNTTERKKGKNIFWEKLTATHKLTNNLGLKNVKESLKGKTIHDGQRHELASCTMRHYFICGSLKKAKYGSAKCSKNVEQGILQEQVFQGSSLVQCRQRVERLS